MALLSRAMARAYVQVSPDTREFAHDMEAGLRRQNLARMGARHGKVFGKGFGIAAAAGMSVLSAGFTAAAVGIGKGVAEAVKFQAQMTKIRTMAGGTAGDVKILSKEVLGLGRTAEQGPNELAAALYHLKSVGMDNVSAMRALKTASNLAAEGGADLEATTNALAGAWRSGIKGAQRFGEAASTVNAIIGAGNMTMDQFTEAIGTGILPSAKTFGLTLKQVGAALALMTDEGIPAVDAATRLRMTFALMGAPSGAATKALEGIGLKSTDLNNVMRSPKGLIGALELFQKHLKGSGLTAAEQAQVIVHAFGGGRSSAAIMTLLNNLDVLKQKQDQINKSVGKYGDAVAAQRATTEGMWNRLRATLETIEIQVGQAVLPGLLKLGHWLLSTGIPAMEQFWRSTLGPAIKNLAGIAKTVLEPVFHLISGNPQLVTALVALAAIGKVGGIIGRVFGSLKGTFSGIAKWATGTLGMQAAGDTMVVASGAMQRAADTMVAAAAAQGFPTAKGKGRAPVPISERPPGGIVIPPYAKTPSAGMLEKLLLSPQVLAVMVAATAAAVYISVKGRMPTHTYAQVPGAPGTLQRVTPPVGRAGVTLPTLPQQGFRMAGPMPAPHAAMTAKQWANLRAQTEDVNALAHAFGNYTDAVQAANYMSPAAIRAASDLSKALDAQQAAGKRATGQIDNYGDTVRLWGKNAEETQPARRHLLADLLQAGVNAKTARTDLNKYSTAVQQNGAQSDKAQDARAKLLKDILDASVKSQHGRRDIDRLTTAIRDNGSKSDEARKARTKLINDLVNSGMSAKDAKKLVDKFSDAVRKIPGGRDTTISVTASGHWAKSMLKEYPWLQGAAGMAGYHGRPPGKRLGGLLPGYGGGDRVPIMAEAGEAVVPKDKARMPGFKAWAAAMGIPGFRTGGAVGNWTPGFDAAGFNQTDANVQSVVADIQAHIMKEILKGGGGGQLVSLLRKYVGRVPYIWGGDQLSGWDCSGMVSWGLRKLGILSGGRMTAAGFQNWGKPAPNQSGAMVFFGKPAYHIGVSMGNGHMIAAADPRQGTIIDSIAGNSGFAIPPMGWGRSSGGTGPTTAVNLGREMAARYGWGAGRQWMALYSLWNGESGWNPNARNPSSGAAGIPQDITGNMHGGAAGQIAWGLQYIAGRYGSPARAYAAWLSRSPHWYGRGTRGAMPGWGWVGEHGKELVKFFGGEPVLSHADSMSAAPGYATGTERARGRTLVHEFAGADRNTRILRDMHRFLGVIADYYSGTARRRRDDLVRDQARDMASVAHNLSHLRATQAAARSYAAQVRSGLAGYADLSGLAAGPRYVGTRHGFRTISAPRFLSAQLGTRLGELRRFASVLRRLDRRNVPASLIRQIVDLGPGPGTKFGRELLSASPSLLRRIRGQERAISTAERRIGHAAAQDVYGDVLGRSSKGLERQFQHLGRVLGREAARWFGAGPLPRRRRHFQHGGHIAEPIVGFGARTGTEYAFHANEDVVPGATMAGIEARLDALIAAVQANAGQTAAGLGDVLNGTARKAVYGAAYQVR